MSGEQGGGVMTEEADMWFSAKMTLQPHLKTKVSQYSLTKPKTFSFFSVGKAVNWVYLTMKRAVRLAHCFSHRRHRFRLEILQHNMLSGQW